MTLSSKFHLLPLLVAAGAPAFSQSATQSIQGLVTDSTGAFVAGANITATNQGTNIALTTTSNETGNFTFPLLPVGDYTVRCERPGFKAGLVRGLRLETAAQVRQDFKLDVGSVTESIEVAANAVSLQTENATVGAVIENRRIVELPLNGRNMQSLAVLVSGVQYGDRTGRDDGSGGFPIPGQGFSVSANGTGTDMLRFCLPLNRFPRAARRAFGADDVVASGVLFRKLRFQMIADTLFNQSRSSWLIAIRSIHRFRLSIGTFYFAHIGTSHFAATQLTTDPCCRQKILIT